MCVHSQVYCMKVCMCIRMCVCMVSCIARVHLSLQTPVAIFQTYYYRPVLILRPNTRPNLASHPIITTL